MMLLGFPVVECSSGLIDSEVVYGATELKNHKCWALVVRHDPVIPLMESRSGDYHNPQSTGVELE